MYPYRTNFFGTRTFFIRTVPKIFCRVNGALYANQIAKIHAKIELSLFGISANRAHPKRASANINKRNMDHKTFYERFHLNISTDYIKIKELQHSFLGDL